MRHKISTARLVVTYIITIAAALGVMIATLVLEQKYSEGIVFTFALVAGYFAIAAAWGLAFGIPDKQVAHIVVGLISLALAGVSLWLFITRLLAIYA